MLVRVSRRNLFATSAPLPLPVAHPSIATCCPPQSGDRVAHDAAVHRCCTAARFVRGD
jgi:hypothetical protein